MTNIITFYEHDLIPFKKLQNSLNLSENEIVDIFKKINDSFNKEIENDDDEKGMDGIFRIYYKKVKAKQYVGFVAIGDKTIQILPKVFKECEYDKNSKS